MLHTSFHTVKHIDKWGLKILPHPPNLPDLAPCDYGFFPKLKAELRGTCFPSIQSLQKEVRRILLSWKPQVFSDILHELVGRWQKCSAAEGNYFEGDDVQIDPLFVRDGTSEEESDSDSESDQ